MKHIFTPLPLLTALALCCACTKQGAGQQQPAQTSAPAAKASASETLPQVASEPAAAPQVAHDTTPASAAAPVQAAPSGCRNLQRVTDINHLLRQLADNLDNACLFNSSVNSLNNTLFEPDTADTVLFPELDPNAEDYRQRIDLAFEAITTGGRAMPPPEKWQEYMREMEKYVENSIGFHLLKGSSTFSMQGRKPRETRELHVSGNLETTPRDLFGNIKDLPPDLAARGITSRNKHGGTFRLPADCNPDRPFLLIEFDEAGRNTNVAVYERVADPRRSGCGNAVSGSLKNDP
jgi:hypothetical protein